MTVRILLPACAVVASMLSTGCGDDATPTSPTTTATGPVTELFAVTLPARGSSFYSYAVSSPGGTVSVTLASVTMGSDRVASANELILGIGTPSGESCAITQTTNATPALAPQLTLNQSAGTYCVHIADAGTLTGPANVAVRIVHP